MDPGHKKRAGPRTPLPKNELVNGPANRKELVHGPRSRKKSWSTDSTPEKRAGPWKLLTKKELVHGSCSQKKSWSTDPTQEKRADNQ